MIDHLKDICKKIDIPIAFKICDIVPGKINLVILEIEKKRCGEIWVVNDGVVVRECYRAKSDDEYEIILDACAGQVINILFCCGVKYLKFVNPVDCGIGKRTMEGLYES